VQDCIPVMHGMPPYDYFAIPPEKDRIPIHCNDVGTIILADLISVRSCISVKDERGLYTGGFLPIFSASTICDSVKH
jgi:molybdenum storage protein